MTNLPSDKEDCTRWDEVVGPLSSVVFQGASPCLLRERDGSIFLMGGGFSILVGKGHSPTPPSQ